MKSDFSGELEVTWYNGIKLLDSKHANYSYGQLQEVLAFGLSKIDFKDAKQILLLGMGGGSVITSLRNQFNFQRKIIAVEFDQKIIELAETEFGISAHHKLDIKYEDALSYVENCQTDFDLIIIDLFIDDKVPEKFYKRMFWQNIQRILSAKGSILFNAGLKTDTDKFLTKLKINISGLLAFREVHYPGKPNRLLIISHESEHYKTHFSKN